MKKAIAILLTLILLPAFAVTESIIDLSSLTNDELEKLITEAQLEINQRAENTIAITEWNENDFVFYDENGRVALKPTFSKSWISMEKIESGQT